VSALSFYSATFCPNRTTIYQNSFVICQTPSLHLSSCYFPPKKPGLLSSKSANSCQISTKGWQRPTGGLVVIGHFPQKRPEISGWLAKNKLQPKASYLSSPPCTVCQNSLIICQNPTWIFSSADFIKTALQSMNRALWSKKSARLSVQTRHSSQLLLLSIKRALQSIYLYICIYVYIYTQINVYIYDEASSRMHDSSPSSR